MKTRQFKKIDLLTINHEFDSMQIPVLYKGKERLVCDKHFADDELCYLSGAKGKPTKISDLQFILYRRKPK